MVPIRAVGARALLDFPDRVVFKPGPVKYRTVRTLLVRNVGASSAVFETSVDNEAFALSPSHGELEASQSLQIEVSFEPHQAGSHQGHITVTYGTGEQVTISVSGEAEESNVRLEKQSLRLENTFISRSCMRTFKVFNRR